MKKIDMPIDESNIFRQVTVRICGNLDIEAAMRSCTEYMAQIMPVDGMSLHLFDKDFLYIRTIAHIIHNRDTAKLGKAVYFDKIVHLSKEIRERAQKEWPNMQWKDVTIFNSPEYSDPLAKNMLKSIKKPDACGIVMRLKIEGNKVGLLAAYVDGKGQYTKKHAHYLSLLHDPFAIAMANAIKHEEVINLKDKLADDIQYLSKEISRICGGEVIGQDGGLKDVMRMVRQIATIDSPVLLLGETGVGKEVIANLIHNMSFRKEGPFIKINCGAIPETLVDSELFGHEKGAFTGAFTQKRGRFERAHKGTILLDEIGELPLPVQIRLLRVFQNKEIERVGGSTPVPIDVRIISATHRNLEDMVSTGKFREDLWFRLNVFPIMIPPLRQRKEDIPALVHYFVERKSKELRVKAVRPFSPKDIDRFMAYRWPGNVRELENVVERALIQSLGENTAFPTYDRFMFRQRLNGAQALMGQNREIEKLDESIAFHIQRALDATNGKIDGPGGASELLGVNPSTLRTKMKKLGILRRRK